MPNPFSTKAGKSPSDGTSSKKMALRKASKGGSASTSGTKPANPWSSRLGKTDSSQSSLRTTSKKATKRGISRGGRSSVSSASHAKKQTGYTLTTMRTGPDVTGVSVGDRVRITWAVDRAFGTGDGEFVGVVTALDDWITANNSGVQFHYPLSSLGGVERVEHKPKRVKVRRG